jgi:hypothetical protein
LWSLINCFITYHLYLHINIPNIHTFIYKHYHKHFAKVFFAHVALSVQRFLSLCTTWSWVDWSDPGIAVRFVRKSLGSRLHFYQTNLWIKNVKHLLADYTSLLGIHKKKF